MARYSRTEDGEIVEHFDSLEELEATNRTIPPAGSYLGFFVFFASGVALTYFVFHKLNLAEAPKWVKATAILLTATPLGVLGYKFGELIFGLFIWLLIAFFVIGLAIFAWSLL